MSAQNRSARPADWTQLSVPLLRCFAAVYSELSMTRAALSLRTPQSTLSTCMARLRKIYADPLFVPGGGHLEPTAKAHEIAGPILGALAQLESSAYSRADFRPEKVAAQVHIAMVDLVQYRLLPRLVETLALEAPRVRLSVTNFVAESVGRHLASRQLDLAVASTSLSLRSVRFSQLYGERFTCILRRDHPLAAQKWTLKHFVSLSHIQVSPVGSTFVSIIDRVLAERGLRRHVDHYVPTYHVAARIIARSDHVALMPTWIAANIAKGDRWLVVKPPPVTLPQVPVIQMWHERSQTDPFHRWLRHRFVELSRSVRDEDRQQPNTDRR